MSISRSSDLPDAHYSIGAQIPAEVRTTEGTLVVTGTDIEAGQNVWQSMGGMELGSIWGHGSYVAPDWTADWLHRELGRCARRLGASGVSGAPYARCPERQAALRSRPAHAVDPHEYLRRSNGRLTISDRPARAFEANARYYAALFRDGRAEYAIPPGALTDPRRARQLAAFFFWTSWAASTNRPGDDRHLHQQLAARAADRQSADRRGHRLDRRQHHRAARPASASWPGGTRRAHAASRSASSRPSDPLLGSVPTPSQRATVKYFWIVSRADPRADRAGRRHRALRRRRETASTASRSPRSCPTAVARTWHVQLGTLLDRDRLAGRRAVHRARGERLEPTWQRLGVNVLFGALLVVVVGSMVGQWLSVKQLLPDDALVLLRPQRLRVHRPRARLADRPARRPAALAAV